MKSISVCILIIMCLPAIVAASDLGSDSEMKRQGAVCLSPDTLQLSRYNDGNGWDVSSDIVIISNCGGSALALSYTFASGGVGEWGESYPEVISLMPSETMEVEIIPALIECPPGNYYDILRVYDTLDPSNFDEVVVNLNVQPPPPEIVCLANTIDISAIYADSPSEIYCMPIIQYSDCPTILPHICIDVYSDWLEIVGQACDSTVGSCDLRYRVKDTLLPVGVYDSWVSFYCSNCVCSPCKEYDRGLDQSGQVCQVAIKLHVLARNVWYVDDDNITGPWYGSQEYPFNKIQEAIDSASNGDTIMVLAGTYADTGNFDINPQGKSIYLISADGPGSAVISLSSEYTQRGFLINSGEDSSTVIDGFTIRGTLETNTFGWDNYGLYCINSSPTIRNCTFTENWCWVGSGIKASGSSSRVINCTFTGNWAGNAAYAQSYSDDGKSQPEGEFLGANGAGMYLESCNMLIYGCTFTSNQVDAEFGDQGGGGIFTRNSILTIDSCRFASNTVNGYGRGGAIMTSNCDLNVTRCIFQNNESYDNGGAVLGEGIFTDCVFWNNRVTVRGGAYAGSGIFERCLFDSNTSTRDEFLGGGGGAFYGTGTFLNCTFVRNSGCAGNALLLTDSFSVIQNSIFAFSASPCHYDSNYSHAIEGCADIYCSNIYGNMFGDWVGCISSQANINNNFSADPRFCDISAGDFTLREHSPCLPENNACGELIGTLGLGCLSQPSAWYVDDDNVTGPWYGSQEYPFNKIQEAIDSASNGDTIMVLAGTYVDTGNFNININGKSVYIKSADGPGLATISIPYEHDNKGIIINSGEDSSTVIDGLRFTTPHEYCLPWDNNAIYCVNSSPKIINCVFIGNAGWTGSGILFRHSSSHIANCSFINNSAGCAPFRGNYEPALAGNSSRSGDAKGGGIFADSSNVIIKGCSFIGNDIDAEFDEQGGGGIFARASTIVIDSCSFNGNNVYGPSDLSGSGGGAIMSLNSEMTVTRSSFHNNGSCYRGGAIYGNGNFTDCQFEDNRATVLGGAVSGSGTFTQCVFYNNKTTRVEYWDYNGGGAFYGTGNFINCTFAGNLGCIGSALCFTDSNALIQNSIIAFNTSMCPSDSDYSRAVAGCATIYCTDIYGNMFGDWVGCISSQANINNNFSADPRFCDISTGDFTLRDHSPCLPENNACGELIGALGLGCLSQPRIWHVEANGNDFSGDGSQLRPFKTIQRGIDASYDQDTVLVGSGTYTGSGNHNIRTYGKKILVKSMFGRDSTTIAVQPADFYGDYRAFLFDNNEDSATVLDGFTITPAAISFEDQGGVIYCFRSSPTITNCSIRGNHRRYGGGMHLFASSSKVIDCQFYKNIAGCGPCKAQSSFFNSHREETEEKSFGPFGGGIYIDSSNISIIQCSFDSNLADGGECYGGGGGIYVQNSTIHIYESDFTRNMAGNCDGGGIRATNSTVNVERSRFIGNYTGAHCAWGGAISSSGTLLIVRESNFDSNVSWGFSESSGGGAIYGDGTFIGCVFRGNQSKYSGGAVLGGGIFDSCLFDRNVAAIAEDPFQGGGGAIMGAPVLRRSTLTRNGSCEGGALYLTDQTSVQHSIIAFNKTGNGYPCSDTGYVIQNCHFATMFCTDIFGNGTGDSSACIKNQVIINSNFSKNPLFCDTTDNNFNLHFTSPCAPANNSCNTQIGAFGVDCFVCGDANGNGVVNILDVTYLLSYLYKGGPTPVPIEAGDANGNGAVNILDVTYLIAYLYKGGPAPNCP